MRNALLALLILPAAAACGATDPSPSGVTLPLSWPTTQPNSGDQTNLLAQAFAEFDDVSAGRFHTGLDIRANANSSVLAAAEGWVALLEKNDPAVSCPGGVRCDHGMGNTLILGHQLTDGRQIFTQYSHMVDWDVATPVYSEVVDSPDCQQEVVGLRWICGPQKVPVLRGQVVGGVGGTGRELPSWPEHLHFEVKPNPMLSLSVNDGAGRDYGYSALDPTGSYYDPIEFFHPEAKRLLQARPIRALPTTSGVYVIMGPGGELVGGRIVQYRAIDVLGPSLSVEVIAEARTPSIAGCEHWYRVRKDPASPTPLLHDVLDPIPPLGAGEIPTGWVCADLVTTNIPPTLLAASLTAGSAPSDLYTVEVASNGVDTRIARLHTAGGQEPVMTDIAVLQDGSLVGISFSDLYTIDQQSGLCTLLAPLGPLDANGLAASAAGVLYASTLSGQLLRRNPQGLWDALGSFGGSMISNGDLAFAPSGELYATLGTPAGTTVLALINPATGAATVRSPAAGIGFGSVWGLSFVAGKLYGLTTDLAAPAGKGRLILIDVASGLGTDVRPLGFGAGGAALRQ